jgi:hypothetical protein
MEMGRKEAETAVVAQFDGNELNPDTVGLDLPADGQDAAQGRSTPRRRPA